MIAFRVLATLSLFLTDTPPTDVEALRAVADLQADTTSVTANLDAAPTGRYLTVWFTSLPTAVGGFKGGIVDLVVRG